MQTTPTGDIHLLLPESGEVNGLEKVIISRTKTANENDDNGDVIIDDDMKMRIAGNSNHHNYYPRGRSAYPHDDQFFDPVYFKKDAKALIPSEALTNSIFLPHQLYYHRPNPNTSNNTVIEIVDVQKPLNYQTQITPRSRARLIRLKHKPTEKRDKSRKYHHGHGRDQNRRWKISSHKKYDFDDSDNDCDSDSDDDKKKKKKKKDSYRDRDHDRRCVSSRKHGRNDKDKHCFKNVK